jgi:plastocyanin
VRRRGALASFAAVVVVVALAAWSAWAGAGPIAGAGAAAKLKPAPTHLLVYAQEWSVWPSRESLPAGTIHVELWNRGQDMHDLRIRHVNTHSQMVGPVDGAVKVTPSGGITYATWHLKRGRYMIYCSMPGHFQMGMHARITVT